MAGIDWNRAMTDVVDALRDIREELCLLRIQLKEMDTSGDSASVWGKKGSAIQTPARMRTIREACKDLKASDPQSAVGETTLRRLVADGAIPSVRIEAKYLIDMDKLECYLSGGQEL